MIVYNVTCNVSPAIVQEWVVWIREHIPQVLGTGLFSEARFTQVLVEQEDKSQTFSIQYKAHSKEALATYYSKYAEALQKEGTQKFGEQVLTFRTELEIIDEYTVRPKS